MNLASLPRISANLNDSYTRYNFQAFTNIFRNFQKISRNIKFPVNLQPYSYACICCAQLHYITECRTVWIIVRIMHIIVTVKMLSTGVKGKGCTVQLIIRVTGGHFEQWQPVMRRDVTRSYMWSVKQHQGCIQPACRVSTLENRWGMRRGYPPPYPIRVSGGAS